MASRFVIQTYKPPQAWTGRPLGLGDFVRGICHLKELVDQSEVELRVDVSQTEFALLIKQDPTFFIQSDPLSVQNAWEFGDNHEFTVERIKAFIESNASSFHLSTNLGDWKRTTLPDSIRQFSKKFYAFHPWVERQIAQWITAPNYEVVSIRCGDAFYGQPSFRMRPEITDRVYHILEQHVLPRLSHPLVATSDSYALKMDLVQRYGLGYLPHQSQHGAYGQALPVALDLCLLKNSQFNYHLNPCSTWWSGFSHYTSMIFEIPSLNFRLPNYDAEEITSHGQLTVTKI